MCSIDDTIASSTPLYATQGGGYAIFKNDRFVWHSDIPEFLGDAKVGDPIPKEWSTTAINNAALEEEEAYEISCEVEEAFRREDEENLPTTGEVRSRALAHFGGNTELAREAAELYPGDFI